MMSTVSVKFRTVEEGGRGVSKSIRIERNFLQFKYVAKKRNDLKLEGGDGG